MTVKTDITLNIATANSRKAKVWKNQKISWMDLVITLANTQRTKETINEYLKLPKDKQDEIKDVGGFVGGYLNEGKRRNGYVRYRQLVCLDIDFGDLEIWEAFKAQGYAGLVYSTHKHTPENPRLRLVFPLDRQVDVDEYEAIARMVASWFGIDKFDDTTYQAARLMYYPSTSKDGVYYFDHVDAPVMRADEVLNEYDDWTNTLDWPVSSRVKDIVHNGDATLEDPTAKPGIVGAFCRAYSITEAISEFLSDVYEPSELGADRYTFINGSTSGGLIVYDNKLCYSHHGTDPISGKTCNAFDLVRLHKFGDLDRDSREDATVTALPSYKRMVTFAIKQKPVKALVAEDRLKEAAEEFGINPLDDTEDSREWLKRLESDNKENIKNTINNVTIVLENDKNLAGKFAYNEFEQREVALTPLFWDKPDKKYPRALTDADDAELMLYFERVYNITHKENIRLGLTVVTKANGFHPVKKYLNTLEWDGVERLDTLLIDCFGAEDTPYTRAITRKTLVAGIARIYDPGCKFDHVLTLVGEERMGKSTIFDKLGKTWFSDSLYDIKGKEAAEQLQGVWILEMSESTAVKNADVNTVKQFLSKRTDRYRVAYGRRTEDFPRQCIIVATGNDQDFLKDATGNRRFWVVDFLGRKGSNPPWELDEDTINQLWAEAKDRYFEGETLYLPEELELVARDIQDAHLERDERSGIIYEYLNTLLPEDWDDKDLFSRRTWLEDKGSKQGTVKRTRVCIAEIWAECLGKNPSDITRKDSYAISRIMKTNRDWKPAKRAVWFKLYGSQKGYEKVNV